MADAGSNGNGFAQRYSSIIQTVMVVAAFMGGFWAGVINPISSRIDRVDMDTIKVREHEAYQKRIDERVDVLEKTLLRANDGMRKRYDDITLALQGSVTRALDNTVSKDTYTLRSQAEDARFQRMQNDLKDIRDLFGGSYSIKDALAQLQRDQADLRTKLFNFAPSVTVQTPDSRHQ